MTDALEAVRREAQPLEGARSCRATIFFASLAEQFDAVIQRDVRRAVEPLERLAPVPAGELPETYPWGV